MGSWNLSYSFRWNYLLVFIDPNKWIYLCDLEDFQASKWTERSSINAFHLCRLQPFEPTKHFFFQTSKKKKKKMEKREMTEKINQILIWYCKESWFDNVVHWLVLWWTPCFEGLDVCLKGLAQRISRVFPVSIQPNWADRQRNSTCLCLTHFRSPNIYLSLCPVFIICKVVQVWAQARLRGQA